MNYRGAWSSSTAYVTNDLVTYLGTTYIALVANTGSTPGMSSTVWAVFAAAGDVTTTVFAAPGDLLAAGPLSGGVYPATRLALPLNSAAYPTLYNALFPQQLAAAAPGTGTSGPVSGGPGYLHSLKHIDVRTFGAVPDAQTNTLTRASIATTSVTMVTSETVFQVADATGIVADDGTMKGNGLRKGTLLLINDQTVGVATVSGQTITTITPIMGLSKGQPVLVAPAPANHVGSGTATDNTAAFQAAINALASSGNGGTLYVPNPIGLGYWIAGQLTFPEISNYGTTPSITIEGQSAGAFTTLGSTLICGYRDPWIDTRYPTDAKIVAIFRGTLIIRDITLANALASGYDHDYTPFLLCTGAVPYTDRCQVRGDGSGAASFQGKALDFQDFYWYGQAPHTDFLVYGNPGDAQNAGDLGYSGYGGAQRDCTYSAIRRIAFFRSDANDLEIVNPQITDGCGNVDTLWGPSIDIEGGVGIGLRDIGGSISGYNSGFRVVSSEHILDGLKFWDGIPISPSNAQFIAPQTSLTAPAPAGATSLSTYGYIQSGNQMLVESTPQAVLAAASIIGNNLLTVAPLTNGGSSSDGGMLATFPNNGYYRIWEVDATGNPLPGSSELFRGYAVETGPSTFSLVSAGQLMRRPHAAGVTVQLYPTLAVMPACRDQTTIVVNNLGGTWDGTNYAITPGSWIKIWDVQWPSFSTLNGQSNRATQELPGYAEWRRVVSVGPIDAAGNYALTLDNPLALQHRNSGGWLKPNIVSVTSSTVFTTSTAGIMPGQTVTVNGKTALVSAVAPNGSNGGQVVTLAGLGIAGMLPGMTVLVPLMSADPVVAVFETVGTVTDTKTFTVASSAAARQLTVGCPIIINGQWSAINNVDYAGPTYTVTLSADITGLTAGQTFQTILPTTIIEPWEQRQTLASTAASGVGNNEPVAAWSLQGQTQVWPGGTDTIQLASPQTLPPLLPGQWVCVQYAPTPVLGQNVQPRYAYAPASSTQYGRVARFDATRFTITMDRLVTGDLSGMSSNVLIGPFINSTTGLVIPHWPNQRVAVNAVLMNSIWLARFQDLPFLHHIGAGEQTESFLVSTYSLLTAATQRAILAAPSTDQQAIYNGVANSQQYKLGAITLNLTGPVPSGFVPGATVSIGPLNPDGQTFTLGRTDTLLILSVSSTSITLRPPDNPAFRMPGTQLSHTAGETVMVGPYLVTTTPFTQYAPAGEIGLQFGGLIEPTGTATFIDAGTLGGPVDNWSDINPPDALMGGNHLRQSVKGAVSYAGSFTRFTNGVAVPVIPGTPNRSWWQLSSLIAADLDGALALDGPHQTLTVQAGGITQSVASSAAYPVSHRGSVGSADLLTLGSVYPDTGSMLKLTNNGTPVASFDALGNLSLPLVTPPPIPVMTGSGTGNITGTGYQWVASYTLPKGQETLPSAPTTPGITLNAASQSFIMPPASVVPTGATINLYRTKSGAPGVYYHVTSNLLPGASYTDNAADGSLGAQRPLASSGATARLTIGSAALATNPAGQLVSLTPLAISAGSGQTADLFTAQVGGVTRTRIDSGGSLFLGGGIAAAVVTRTASASIGVDDYYTIANGSGLTLTLPAASAAITGRTYVVINGASGASTIVASAGGTINGAVNDTSLTAAYAVGRYVTDGANWYRW